MHNDNSIALIFSEKDNQSLNGKAGWVDNFCKYINILFRQVSRSKKVPEVKLISDINFDARQLDEFGIVITIFTQNLTENGEIILALNNHCEKLKDQDKLIVDGLSCFYKVLKKPSNVDHQLKTLEEVLTYDFYLLNNLTGKYQECVVFSKDNKKNCYWVKLADLVYDIRHVLDVYAQMSNRKEPKKPRNKTVYLASTGADMIVYRDTIKRELKRHGYRVLPIYSLPKENIDSLQNKVSQDLEQSRLSIHLVGADYGHIPKHSKQSIMELEHNLTKEHTLKTIRNNKQVENKDKQSFNSLIWIAPYLKNISERQQIFIEELKSNASLLSETEVLEVPLEEFSMLVRKKLEDTDISKNNNTIKKSDYHTKSIYLIVDKNDTSNNILEIKQTIENNGFEVLLPSYEGDLTNLRHNHQNNLIKSDAAIIYYGYSTEDWIKTKLQDLLKSPGFGRAKPFVSKAVYLNGNKQIDKGYYEKHNTSILGGKNTLDTKQIEHFLKQITL